MPAGVNPMTGRPGPRRYPGGRAQVDRKQANLVLGAWLQSLRMQRHLTQRQLAEMIGLKYYTYIAQIEAGMSRLPLQRIPAYAQALGMPVDIFVSAMRQHLLLHGIAEDVYDLSDLALMMEQGSIHQIEC